MDLSPVLFEDSPSSSPCLIHEGAAGDGVFEVFGKSIEEAVREMRFRIEQKTMLTASAGQEEFCIIFYYILCVCVCVYIHIHTEENKYYSSTAVLGDRYFSFKFGFFFSYFLYVNKIQQ